MRRATLMVALSLAPGAAWGQALDFSKGGAIDITAQSGMEWRQNERKVIARGDARAVRGDVTVTSDELIAYYRKKAGDGPTPAAGGGGAQPAEAKAGPGDGGSTEIYRIEAVGHVRIFTKTDLAVGDRAIYDIDQALLLLMGSKMSITTPQDVLTARDTMEYWAQRRMAVARGLATVTTAEGRQVSADVLVAYSKGDERGGAGTPASSSSSLAGSGKLERVEAFGQVEIRTATETVKGDRGVYATDSEIARLVGNVRITRGQNQLQGEDAVVNMQSGVSTLVNEPGKRVEGLIVPGDASRAAGEKESGSSTPGSKR